MQLKRAETTLTKRRKIEKDDISAYLMLLPFFILFCMFTVYPLCWGIRFMFYRYDGITQPHFIGLDNFVRIFTRDTIWWKSVLNTFVFAGMKLALEIPLALLLAAMLNSKIKGRSFFRCAYFMPTITSAAIMGMVFAYLFSAYNGIINVGLKQMGFISEYLNFLETPSLAMLSVVIAAVWAAFGQNVLFFLSGMQNISRDIYESAEIDGANARQKFFKITLPMLAPFLQIILMLAIICSLRDYDAIMVMTNGGPNKATLVMGLEIYQQFFAPTGVPQYGYGAAQSFVSALIIGIFTAIYLVVSKKMQDVE